MKKQYTATIEVTRKVVVCVKAHNEEEAVEAIKDGDWESEQDIDIVDWSDPKSVEEC